MRRWNVDVSLSISFKSLVILGLFVAGSSLSGCNRKKQKLPPLKVAVDLSDPAQPVLIRQGLEFDTKAGDKGWIWKHWQQTIDGRRYLSSVLYAEPKSSSSVVLAGNEFFKIFIGIDPNSATTREGEILMFTKVDVEFSAKPSGIAQSVIDAITGRPLSEESAFPPGTYTFRVIRPAVSGTATSRSAHP